MTRSEIRYQIVLKIASTLFIVLFVYAATSKFLEFDQFKIQLGQSPIITAYANGVAWGVPLIEFVIAVLFLFPRLVLSAFYASLSLMTMFTTYIVLILNFSEYIPCSCGGVLENMSWPEHLFFNLMIIGVAIVGILLTTKTDDASQKMNKIFIA